jgi:heme/copper-type cytochrome/quinol oxidase subunit 2
MNCSEFVGHLTTTTTKLATNPTIAKMMQQYKLNTNLVFIICSVILVVVVFGCMLTVVFHRAHHGGECPLGFVVAKDLR